MGLAISRELKENLNDPESLQMTKILVSTSGTYCAKFRSKNAFGGLVLGSLVLHDENSWRDNEGKWSEYCNASDLHDVTAVVKLYL